MSQQIAIVDERVELPDGPALRVLRRGPSGSDGGQPRRAGRAPFLLVHGLASNARLWDGVARRLADAGRTSVAVDLRGHGLSDKPETGYDFATISNDLRSLIAALGSGF